MTVSRNWWLGGCLVVLSAAVLPTIALKTRRPVAERCTFDGVSIAAHLRVRIVTADSVSRSFCSIVCAENWLAHGEPVPRRIFVTDEQSGKEISADQAYFVRSLVVAHVLSGDRRHTFSTREQAEKHQRDFRGQLLQQRQRPFAGYLD